MVDDQFAPRGVKVTMPGKHTNDHREDWEKNLEDDSYARKGTRVTVPAPGKKPEDMEDDHYARKGTRVTVAPTKPSASHANWDEEARRDSFDRKGVRVSVRPDGTREGHRGAPANRKARKAEEKVQAKRRTQENAIANSAKLAEQRRIASSAKRRASFEQRKAEREALEAKRREVAATVHKRRASHEMDHTAMTAAELEAEAADKAELEKLAQEMEEANAAMEAAVAETASCGCLPWRRR